MPLGGRPREECKKAGCAEKLHQLRAGLAKANAEIAARDAQLRAALPRAHNTRSLHLPTPHADLAPDHRIESLEYELKVTGFDRAYLKRQYVAAARQIDGLEKENTGLKAQIAKYTKRIKDSSKLQ